MGGALCLKGASAQKAMGMGAIRGAPKVCKVQTKPGTFIGQGKEDAANGLEEAAKQGAPPRKKPEAFVNGKNKIPVATNGLASEAANGVFMDLRVLGFRRSLDLWDKVC